MRLEEFDYELPRELIAQVPLPRRDASRLMVLHRDRRKIEHGIFSDLIHLLHPGDLLILNDAKVLPCRLRGIRSDSGGKVEVLLIREKEHGTWDVLLKPGSKLKRGQSLVLAGGRLRASLLDEGERSRRLLQFDLNGDLTEVLREWGEMPLPPYIKRNSTGDTDPSLRQLDAERYQTVFAVHEGAVAAPTAGLHFTAEMLGMLRSQGVRIAHLTLWVGPGTFQPVRSEQIAAHSMEAEEYLIPQSTAEEIDACRRRGNRIISVGTTCVRALESAASAEGGNGAVQPGAGVTSLFIYPGYRFKVVDALLTNFHLPRSTLLMLVFAFAGTKLCRKAYQEAIAQCYRFYSYGDAMLIS